MLPASMFELYQMRQRSREFDQIAGIWVTNRALPGKGDPEQGKVGVVTSNFLPLFCPRPVLGRFSGRRMILKMHLPPSFSLTSYGFENSAAIPASSARPCLLAAARRS